MDITNKYKRVELDKIIVRRDERQRREVVVDEGLKTSIQNFGVINPIIITREFVLIAGERRYQTSKELGLHDIPCRFVDDLSEAEAQILELEENLKRQDLTWQDNARAVARLHELYCKHNDDWSGVKTSKVLGVSQSWVSMILRVAQDLHNPKLSQASGLAAAFNVLSRLDDRKMGDALSDIITAGKDMFSETTSEDGAKAESESKSTSDNTDTKPTAVTKSPSPKLAHESILQVDFTEWIKTYKGKPFNFIHCDFPYGLNVFSGEMSGKNEWDGYNDSQEVYWNLIDTLCTNLDKIMAPSAHLMFWFSMEHYIKTLEVFRKKAPSLVFNIFPLVWMKSDNVGILPDARRQPRRVYETCFIASREDRPLAKPVANAYSAPTNKDHHPSTKPEPMLRHFMQMFVDETTRMLDPTCGSGASLRAAESLGATEVLGLELDQGYADAAKAALRKFRILRETSNG